MRKHFLKVSLIGLLAVSMPMSFTSCKDYDDDIESLNKADDELSAQLTALKAASEANAQAAAAAKAAADDAAKAAAQAAQAAAAAQATGDAATAAAKQAEALAQAAKQEAELAKQAAAQAKQEAIDAAMVEINKLKATANATTEQLTALASKVAGIETGLNKLEAEVDANAAAIAQLQIQMKAVEAYKALIAANETAIKANTTAIAANAAAIGSNTEAINKNAASIAANAAAIAANAKDIQGNASAIKALQEKDAKIDEAIAAINKNIDDVEKLIADLAGKVDANKKETDKKIQDVIDNVANQVKDINGKLVTILSKELRSLVFIPTLYADGIEAVEYEYNAYKWYSEQGGTSNAINNEKGVACIVKDTNAKWKFGNGGNSTFNPEKTIQYHLNPSSAVVEKDDLSFVSRDVQVISRGNDSKAAPALVEVASEKGILNVTFTAEGKNIEKAGKGSIFALQAEIKRAENADTTITSDYALLYASTVTPTAIAFNDTYQNVDCPVTGQRDHLYTTVEEVIAAEPTFTVDYDSQIMIKDYMELHYDWVSNTTNAGSHKVWKYGEEAHYGLHYQYDLVDYLVGTNQTSDSKYATIDKATGLLTPCVVDANGNSLKGQQGVSSIGRVPMVRVTVLDENNKVVLYAFVRVAISHEAVIETTKTFVLDTQKFDCNGGTSVIGWAETSYELLEMTASKSKAEFDALYKLTLNGNEARQFTNNKDNVDRNPYVGTINEIVDPTDATTTVLQWVLTKEDQQYVYEQANHTVTVYVRYEHRTAPRLNPTIYLPLQITVTKPEGTVSEKNSNYWFNNMSNVRLNVKYPQDGKDTKDYSVDFNQVWVGNAPKISVTSGYNSFLPSVFTTQMGANGGYKYYFSAKNNGVSVGGHTLYVDNTTAAGLLGASHNAIATYDNNLKHSFLADQGEYTNTKVYVDNKNTLLAELDQTTGVITYADNDVAKELLNKWAANEAQLNVLVGICAYNDCNLSLALKDAIYPAYFLRPINADAKDGGEFQDAQANGSFVNLFDLMSFSDWRGVEFKGNEWLFAFYGVSGFEVDIEGITTTMNGGKLGETLLTSISNTVKFSYVDASGAEIAAPHQATVDLSAYNAASQSPAALAAIKTAMGQIKYENNGNNVSDFKVMIPVKVTYDWGTIEEINIVCDVNGTMGM